MTANQQQEDQRPAGEQPAVVPHPVQMQNQSAAASADYADVEAWPRERLIADLVRTRGELDQARPLIGRISRWILETVPHEVTPERGAVDVASVVIRLLTAWLCNPNGRLGQPVRDALHRLDNLPGAGADASDVRAQVEIVRNHLAIALTDQPRPRSGEGPAPTLDSDDITIVRYDRDRFRVELDLAYESIAQMYAAAVGHRNGPDRGLVEDITDVRARMLAAEQALIIALAGRGEGDRGVPVKGTRAYSAWERLVREVVQGIADTEVATFGGAAMPVAGQKTR